MANIFEKGVGVLNSLRKGSGAAQMSSDLFTPYEKKLAEKKQPWMAELSAGAPETYKNDETSLIIICMTPRSGSSALSAALAQSKSLGAGGERFSPREGGPLHKLMERTTPKTLSGLLDEVISEARSKNGVAQIKCDLPQVMPFLTDPASFERMKHAKFVYLTREDVLDQAISRYKGFKTGYWHSVQDGGTGEVPFDFAGIRQQVIAITNMMAAYERIFAFMGIVPYRITYEQVVTNSGDVIRNIAKLVDVKIEGDISMDAGGHTKIANSQSQDFKARFLKEALAMAQG